MYDSWICNMGRLRLVGSLKWQVSLAEEPYKRNYILQKRPIFLRSLLIVATPYIATTYVFFYTQMPVHAALYLYFFYFWNTNIMQCMYYSSVGCGLILHIYSKNKNKIDTKARAREGMVAERPRKKKQVIFELPVK